MNNKTNSPDSSHRYSWSQAATVAALLLFALLDFFEDVLAELIVPLIQEAYSVQSFLAASSCLVLGLGGWLFSLIWGQVQARQAGTLVLFISVLVSIIVYFAYPLLQGA